MDCLRHSNCTPKTNTEPALNNLEKAGWVVRLTRGFYELDEDPRQD
jgi:predicted transcriptional regulator of viral defense system